MSKDDVDEFIKLISDKPVSDQYFNPWGDKDDLDVEGGVKIRQDNLRYYLNRRLATAKYLIIAEAPGYLGCKWSGIPMTSERQFINPNFFPTDCGLQRSSSSEKLRKEKEKSGAMGDRFPKKIHGTTIEYGFAEKTATIVWNAMSEVGLGRNDFVLWNAFPFHPHPRDDNYHNFSPPEERMINILKEFINLFPQGEIFAVGNYCVETIKEGVGMNNYGETKHPSYGNKKIFTDDLKRWLLTKTL